MPRHYTDLRRDPGRRAQNTRLEPTKSLRWPVKCEEEECQMAAQPGGWRCGPHSTGKMANAARRREHLLRLAALMIPAAVDALARSCGRSPQEDERQAAYSALLDLGEASAAATGVPSAAARQGAIRRGEEWMRSHVDVDRVEHANFGRPDARYPTRAQLKRALLVSELCGGMDPE